jgi:hypothetical protein
MRREEQPLYFGKCSSNGVRIMNEVSIVTRLAQGVLAVTIVFAIAAAMQFSLLD